MHPEDMCRNDLGPELRMLDCDLVVLLESHLKMGFGCVLPSGTHFVGKRGVGPKLGHMACVEPLFGWRETNMNPPRDFPHLFRMGELLVWFGPNPW